MDIKNSWLFNNPIAHRGLHTFEFPENSLAAFNNTIKHNYAIELDVRLTDDDIVVVFHDEKLSRMTNTDGYVSKLKFEELQNLNLLNSDNKPTEERIPTFEKVLEAVNGQVPILVEIKNLAKVGKLESKVIELLRSYNGEIAVQSFNPYSLEYFMKNASNILRGQLSCFFRKDELAGSFKRAYLKKLKMNRVSKPDFVSYRAEDLPNKYVTRANLPVLAWTIGSNADMEAILPHCDNIIFENFIPHIHGKTDVAPIKVQKEN